MVMVMVGLLREEEVSEKVKAGRAASRAGNNLLPFYSQRQKVHSPNQDRSEVRIGSIIVFHLSTSYEKPSSSYCVM